MYSLLIELQSPMCAGSGGPGPGYIDREVVFDDAGLPYIPARRIKGLLRDAFRDLSTSLKRQGAEINFKEAEDKLFGGIGEKFSGALRFRNALLCNRQTKQAEQGLSAWLSSLLANSQGKAILYREEILDAFTEIRRQTRIARATGVAAENTLRVTRTLRAQLEFRAAIDSSAVLSPSAEHLLALSAAALQQIGSSRTRGLGRVRCRLFRADEDLTVGALAALRAGALGTPALIDSPQRNVAPAQLAVATEAAMLRFRITLKQPAIFSSMQGDPNMVASLGYIPGTSIHGWLAWRYLDRHRDDEIFLRLFCRGRLRFLPAYPAIKDENTGKEVRSYPIPFSLKGEKDNEDKYRNLLVHEDWSNTRRIEHAWTQPDQALYHGRLHKNELRSEMQYHHARAGDRRIGRAIGADQSKHYGLARGKEGALFTYEQIRPEAVFAGAIVGDRAALEHLRAALGDLPRAILGRSRSSQYGGDAVWEWLDATPIAEQEKSNFNAAPEFVSTNKVIALVLSQMLAMNGNGHPAAEFPLQQFQRISGLAVQQVSAAFVRTGWARGYLTHQRLARQQLPALQPGSVFELSLAETYQVAALAAAAQKVSVASFGLRAEQGYGRLVLLPFPKAREGRIYPSANSARKTQAQKDSAEWQLALDIYKSRLKKLATDDALDKASRVRGVQSLNAGLLLRLTDLLEMQFKDLRSQTGKFGRRARDRMDSCRVRYRPFEEGEKPNISLEEFILEVSEGSQKYYTALLGNSFTAQEFNEIFGVANPLANDGQEAENLIRFYLKAFLKGLIWKMRKEAQEREAAGVGR